MNQTAQEKLRIAQKYLARKKDIDKAQFLSDALFCGGTLTVLACTFLPVLAMGWTGLVYLLMEIPFLWLSRLALNNRNKIIENTINEEDKPTMSAKQFLTMLHKKELQPYIEKAKELDDIKAVITQYAQNEDTINVDDKTPQPTQNVQPVDKMMQYFEKKKQQYTTDQQNEDIEDLR